MANDFVRLPSFDEFAPYAIQKDESKELDKVFSLFIDQNVFTLKGTKQSEEVWKYAGEKEIQYLRSLETSGEIILLVQFQSPIYGNWDGKNHHIFSVGLILTNCHLYQLQYKIVGNEFYPSRIYSFEKPLTRANAELLSCILKKDDYIGESIWSKVNRVLMQKSENKTHIKGLKSFETIVRIIPGGYLNGKWKQLDGFFGVYYNSETNQISEIPPKME